MTMFAPVDKAFQSMLDDSLGRKLLDPRYERNLKLASLFLVYKLCLQEAGGLMRRHLCVKPVSETLSSR